MCKELVLKDADAGLMFNGVFVGPHGVVLRPESYMAAQLGRDVRLYNYDDAFSEFDNWTAAYDPPSIAAAGVATTTVPAPGATLGLPVTVSFSLPLGGVVASAHVSAADVVTVTLTNPTVAPIDLPSGDLFVRVVQ